MVGFWLETGGFRPNYEKLANMRTWTRPTTRKQLQSYFGIINFFKRFIPNATELMEPLMELKGKSWNWNDVLEKSFIGVYDALVTNTPFLSFPEEGIPLELATDASDFGMGAALFQRVEGEIRYLGFHSKVLRGAEARYSTPKKELLSVMYHIEYYRYWLVGRHFKLYTDNQAMAYALQVHKNEKRDRTVLGWLARLSEYYFTTTHLPGRDNVLPDLLSRVQGLAEETVEASAKMLRTTSVFPFDNLNEATVEQALEAAHSIGHFGANVMYQHLANTLELEIPDLHAKCVDFCKRCKICRRVTKYTLGYSPPRKPIMRLPGEYLHCDVLHMPKSKLGYTAILVVVDDFSKFVWLRPVEAKGAKQVAHHLLDIFTTYGFPSTLRSDRGKEYTNKLVKYVCELGNVEHKFTIAHFHSGNGRVERQNRTIRDTILKLALSTCKTLKEWHTIVPAAMLAMNARVHRSLRASPFHLMFGRTPFSVNLPEYEEDELMFDSDVDEDTIRTQKKFWEIFKKNVIENIHEIKFQDYRKSHYPHKKASFQIGDIVMWKIPNQSIKFQERNIGPFQIDKIDADGLCHIVGKDGRHGIVSPPNFLVPAELNEEEELYDEELDPEYFENEDEEEDDEFSEEGKDDLNDSSFNIERDGGDEYDDDHYI
jgi:hypothetical protein